MDKFDHLINSIGIMTLKEGMICQARVTHTTNHYLQNPEFLAQLMDAQA